MLFSYYIKWWWQHQRRRSLDDSSRAAQLCLPACSCCTTNPCRTGCCSAGPWDAVRLQAQAYGLDGDASQTLSQELTNYVSIGFAIQVHTLPISQ